MIKISFIVLLLTCFISLANCKLGALCFSQLTTATIKCMASQGIVNIMRYPRWPIQSTIKQDLYRIKNAGLGVDIYYQFNQDTIAPEQDVKWFLSQIQPGLINRVWLHAFYGGGRSRWQMNIARIQKYANLFIQNNFKTGIYTTYEAWQLLQMVHKLLKVYLYFGSIIPIIILPLITMYLLEVGKDQLQNNSQQNQFVEQPVMCLANLDHKYKIYAKYQIIQHIQNSQIKIGFFVIISYIQGVYKKCLAILYFENEKRQQLQQFLLYQFIDRLMMKISIYLLLLTCFITKGCCKLGFLCYGQLKTATLQCLASQGIVTIMHPPWPIQSTINQDLYRIKNAGLGVDIYFQFGQGSDFPEQDVKRFLTQIQPGLVDRIWLLPTFEFVAEQDRWSHNIETIKQYAKLFIENKFKTGIYAYQVGWQYMTNNTQLFSSLPLFWQCQQDTISSFDKYVPFGGWQKPTAKKFRTQSICGTIGWRYWEP